MRRPVVRNAREFTVAAGVVLGLGLATAIRLLDEGAEPGRLWPVAGVLAGLVGLAAATARLRSVATVVAGGVMAVGVLALVDPDVGAGTAHPLVEGSTSQVLAISLVLVGVVTLGQAWLPSREWRSIVTVPIGGVLVALAFGGAIDEWTSGLADDRLALLAALRAGVVAALGALVVILGRPTRRQRRLVSVWPSLGLAVLVAGGFVIASQVLHRQEQAQIRQTTRTTAERIVDQLRVKIDGSALGLHRMARAWGWRGRPDRNDWKTDAWLFVDHYPEVRTVAWVDAEHRVQWLSPLAGFHELQRMDLGFERRREEALERAAETERLALSQPVELVTGGTGFLMVAPIGGGADEGSFIVGFYHVDPILRGVLRNVAPGFDVTLVDEGEILFRAAPAERSVEASWHVDAELALHGARWTLQVAPGPDTIAAGLTAMPRVILGVGLALAVLMGLVAHQAQVARQSARRLRKEVQRRSRVQIELRRYQEELEARVEARTRDLDEKQRELEAKNAELERLATTDPLTGVWNRRRFHEHADQEFKGAQRYNRALSLLVLDLDRFKQINDTFGHQAGDDLLCEVTRACAADLRDTDRLARYGGEEFVVLLPETDRDRAMAVAERMRGAIAEVRVACEQGEVRATASFGVASMEPADAGIDDMLGRADKAVYEAKQAGRDCVVFV